MPKLRAFWKYSFLSMTPNVTDRHFWSVVVGAMTELMKYPTIIAPVSLLLFTRLPRNWIRSDVHNVRFLTFVPVPDQNRKQGYAVCLSVVCPFICVFAFFDGITICKFQVDALSCFFSYIRKKVEIRSDCDQPLPIQIDLQNVLRLVVINRKWYVLLRKSLLITSQH